MKIALVIGHIFLHKDILPHVIFAPGHLVLDLALGLKNHGHDVTLFSPGYNLKGVNNINADLTYFEFVLTEKQRDYIDLLKSSPLTFITLSRQVQAELVAKAYSMANKGNFDIVHIYANEEEQALVFASLCNKPVVFTHHEPFNFLNKYKSIFPKYKHLNWVSISMAQRTTMPEDTNWIANIYNAIDISRFEFNKSPKGDYLAYFGRIIKPKGVHLAVKAAIQVGKKIMIAGKHYSDYGSDNYWQKYVEPLIDNDRVRYVGFLRTDKEKQEFLGNAEALMIPSIWDEPFGMVMIEALACGTPVIGLNCGSIPEIVRGGENGYLAEFVGDTYHIDEEQTVQNLVDKIKLITKISRAKCREDFEKRFTTERMCMEYEGVYEKIFINGVGTVI